MTPLSAIFETQHLVHLLSYVNLALKQNKSAAGPKQENRKDEQCLATEKPLKKSRVEPSWKGLTFVFISLFNRSRNVLSGFLR